MGHRRKPDDFIDEPRASQRNIVFPDTVRNARAVDVFLWRGSPNPPLVQRIAAWMFGLTFVGLGLAFAPLAVQVLKIDGSWLGFVMAMFISLSSVMVGIRMFRKGFPRRTKPAQN